MHWDPARPAVSKKWLQGSKGERALPGQAWGSHTPAPRLSGRPVPPTRALGSKDAWCATHTLWTALAFPGAWVPASPRGRVLGSAPALLPDPPPPEGGHGLMGKAPPPGLARHPPGDPQEGSEGQRQEVRPEMPSGPPG